MDRTDLYKDIAQRTNGEVYIGVVGPVRTGKSTFIKRFMDLMVLPDVADSNERRRMNDELPQSGAGRTIMTTQPRFVPNEAAKLQVGDAGAEVSVRLVDCVGYMVEGALGFEENDAARMVMTPWSDKEMPFVQAAELGTHKVISEHSTIGIVMTTDASFTDLERSAYAPAEARVIEELQSLGKPFVIVVNTKDPSSAAVSELCDTLSQKYGVAALPIDVLHMTADEVNDLLERALFEFPLTQAEFITPGWMNALGGGHWLNAELLSALRSRMEGMARVKDYALMLDAFDECEHLLPPQIHSIELGTGIVRYSVLPKEGLFYQVLSEECGCAVESDFQLMSMLKEMTASKQEYDRVKDALSEVRATGYAMIPPEMEELTLDEPEMIQRGSQYGVQLKASGPSLHIIRADVTCEVSPLVGTEQQSEELVKFLLREFENDPAAIWQTNLFGKPLCDLVSEGLSGKLSRMPDDVRDKMRETLSRIINEGGGGVVCILL